MVENEICFNEKNENEIESEGTDIFSEMNDKEFYQ